MKKFSKGFKTIALVLAIALTVSVPNYVGNNKVKADDGQPLEVESTTAVTTAAETTTEKTTETTTVPATTKAPVKKITPAAISNLKATSIQTKKVTLKWTKGKNATEVRIYRSSENKSGKMSKAKKVKTIKGTTWTDSGLSQGTKYVYYVYSYRVSKGVTTHSKAVSITVITKLDSLSKLQATKVSAKSVTIAWSKNKKANKYIVYRAAEKSANKLGKYKKVATLKGSKNKYTDSRVSTARIYSYKVVVQRTSKKNNSLSGARMVQVMTPVPTPTKLKKKKATAKAIVLSWKGVKRADKYEVYKEGKLIGTTKKTSYKVKKLKKGVTYTFSVKAVRKFKNKTYRSGAVKKEAMTKDVMKGTWVEVSIKKQTLYMYVKNKLYVKTPVVTGNIGARSTTKGRHHVIDKASPSRLVGSSGSQSWDVVVKYWLKFTGDGQGIHDSTWRSAYGGNIYKGNGSHGCVNTPIAAMKKIFKKAYVGMPVIVH